MTSYSPRFQQVLSMIDGGSEWLAWAAGRGMLFTGTPEATLLERIQSGLHGSAVAYLPKPALLVHPVKLMELGETALRAIAEGGDDVGRLLARFGLFDEQALVAGERLLAQWGVDGVAQRFGNGLADRIAVARLAADPPDTDTGVLEEAAGFAASQAQNGREFADYLYFYLAVSAAGNAVDAAGRLAAARQTLFILAPHCFEVLRCPELGPLPTLDDLLSALRKWLKAGGALGFETLPCALRNLTAHAGLTSPDGPEVKPAIDHYLAAAAALVNTAQPASVQGAQDGSHMVLRFSDGKARLRLHVDSSGCTSVARFVPAPAAEAQAAPEGEA